MCPAKLAEKIEWYSLHDVLELTCLRGFFAKALAQLHVVLGVEPEALLLFGGGCAHIAHLQRQPDGDARQRVVAVQDDVFGVDFADGVERVAIGVGAAVFGQAVPSIVMPSSNSVGKALRGAK